MRNSIFFILLGIIFATPLFAGKGNSVIPRILYQWEGNSSHYGGTPPFILIRDLIEFDNFWRKHKSGEDMPYVDFEKNMVFVFSPGSSLFDYNPLKVISFKKEGENYILLLSIDRKQTGGFRRGPFVMALLTKVPGGSIIVMRAGNQIKGELPRIPLYCFTEYGGTSDTRILQAKLPKPTKPPERMEDRVFAEKPDPEKVFSAIKSLKTSAAPPAVSNVSAAPQQASKVVARPVAQPKSETKQENKVSLGEKTEKETKPDGNAKTGKQNLLDDPFQDQFTIEF